MATLYRLILIWFPVFAAGFQCDVADQKTFATAFQGYLSNFKIIDPTNYGGYRIAVERIIEEEGFAGSEKICELVNTLNADLKPIEDCIDTAFAAAALNLHPNNSAIIHYFSNIKQWEYACNEGKDRFHSSFDCIRSHPQPHYCLNEHTSCFEMKQEFMCVLHFYREKCGDDAAFVLCSMQTVSFYGQNCLSLLDCKEITNSAGGGYNSTDFEHLRYVVAFWFTCRFAMYWLDLN